MRERPEHKLYSELGALRKLKATNPGMVIGVAGCMAQREADGIRRRVPEVDILLGPRNLHHLPHLIRQRRNGETNFGSDGLDLECDPDARHAGAPQSSAISAYVDVIFGCNFNCTYCAVPSARGPRSLAPAGEVLDEMRQLNDLGYREITLLGQTVNAYGHDLGQLEDGQRIDFAWLLGTDQRHQPQAARALHVAASDVFQCAPDRNHRGHLPSVCEHLHLPLQSGDNDCLRRMKRTYTHRKISSASSRTCASACPDVAVTTDAIVGFCGETEAEFENTLQAFRRHRVRPGVHVRLLAAPHHASVGLARRCAGTCQARAPGAT